MTLIEAVRNYVNNYPRLEGGVLRVDFLDEETGAYSIDAVPAKELVKRYRDGSAVKQYLFVLASRNPYGPHIRQQIDNLGFFEAFSTWLDKGQRDKKLPDLGEGRTAQRLEVVSSGYAMYPGANDARYQIQCRLTYVQKGEQ